ncbi:MAG: MmcB family DNA repair protein [Pseudomonadota bacterium]
MSSRKDTTALITRGVRRSLSALGWETIVEFTPEAGRRIDVLGVDAKGVFWAIEVKSSLEDLRADRKWRDYLSWCDAFSFAVDLAFPIEALPEDVGVLRADAFAAESVRPAPMHPLPAARRTALLRRFARHAAARLRRLEDPAPFGEGA